jgi:hypothetical protein
MSKSALIKHEIYNKLCNLSDQELGAIASYIDQIRGKKGIEKENIFKMEGILKDYDIDLSGLNKMRRETWKHVDEESVSE